VAEYFTESWITSKLLLVFIVFHLIILSNLNIFSPEPTQDSFNRAMNNDISYDDLSSFIKNESIVYAILCPTSLNPSAEPLADWKTRKGVPAKIYNIDGVDGIYADYPNGDNATKIHDFLTSLHENNSNLQWVLIIGDEDLIPSRSVFVNASRFYGLDNYYYSDHYYAGLNNSWDQDNDGIYGEQKGDVDWEADLYVGRLPVNNESEANIAINKILTYERSPEMGQWLSNATFWSGLLDGPNNLSVYQSYKDNAIKVTNKIIDRVPDTMNINHLYDYNQLEPGNYSEQNDILTHKSGKASFYDGQAILSFAGQAYYTGEALAQYFDETGLLGIPDGFDYLFSYNDGKYSTNGNKLPLMYLSTCSVNFSEKDDSNLEQLITAPEGGVIGLIANSGKSYRGEAENGSSYGNWWLVEHFWELFFNGTVQPGKCLYELKKEYVRQIIMPGPPYLRMTVANLVGYNLLGDPELNIWTDIPQNLNFDYSIEYDSNYKLKISVNNDSGAEVENARVCIYNDEIYEYGLTNSSGELLFDLNPRNTGKLEITITSHNYLPKLSNFTYKNKPPEFGIINDISVNEDSIKEDYVDLYLYSIDRDNVFDDLTFSITSITNDSAGVRIDSNNHIDIKPDTDWYGKVLVTLKVSDGFDFDETTFNVTILPENDEPNIIGYIEDQELKVGDSFEYQLQAIDVENDVIFFSDNTKLFNINEATGEFKFKASESDVGIHRITITVSDGNKSSTTKFTIEIIREQTFLELYWFPISVIIITIIMIIGIKIYSITHPSIEEKKDEDKKDKEQNKKSKNNDKKQLSKKEKKII
jgi:hypothetical protein